MDFLVVSGGKIDYDFSSEFIQKQQFDKIIAADSGMDFLYANFDSVNSVSLEFFEGVNDTKRIVFERLIPEKDDTDTEHAIRTAIRLGAKTITIIGGTGTRLDHVLGNISILGIGIEENVQIFLVDSNNRIQMISKSLIIKKNQQFGKYVSLIPYTDKVEGLTLKGFKYNLENFTMTGHNSLGVSNEICDEEATIELKNGELIVVESRD